jgi:hypothetical protein
MTVRELIMELRKIGNHNALVFLDSGAPRNILAIEAQEHGNGRADIVYLRTYKEHGNATVLSSSRKIVWQTTETE